MAFIVVEAGDQRQAYGQLPGGAIQHGVEVVEDESAALSGEFPMNVVVRMFHVVEEAVGGIREGKQILAFAEPRRFQREMDAVAFARCHEVKGEGRLCEHFTAGKRHAAAGIAVKRHVLFDIFEHVRRVAFDPCDLERLAGAFLRAQPAAVAQGTVEDYCLAFTGDGALRADLRAVAAGEAFIRMVQQFGLVLLRSGVGAPAAAQGAAFQENHGADARAVVDAVVLDVFENSLHGGPSRALQGVDRAAEDVVLHLAAELDEIGAVSGHAHEERAVFLGPFLRAAEDVLPDHIELDMEDVHVEEGLQES